jgi:hypothetical protein
MNKMTGVRYLMTSRSIVVLLEVRYFFDLFRINLPGIRSWMSRDTKLRKKYTKISVFRQTRSKEKVRSLVEKREYQIIG